MSIRSLAALALTVIASSAVAAESPEHQCGTGAACGKKSTRKTAKQHPAAPAKDAATPSVQPQDVAAPKPVEEEKSPAPAMDAACGKMMDASCAKKSGN